MNICKKKFKLLPPEPQLSDFYHPSEAQKNYELLFVAVGTGIGTYTLYKYLKQMTDKLYQAYYQPNHLWTGNKAIKELHKITPMSKKTPNHGYPNKYFGKSIYHPQKK